MQGNSYLHLFLIQFFSRKSDHSTEMDSYGPSNSSRQSPIKQQTEQRTISPAKNVDQEERELTKLELNLKRFEEERRKFEYEKEKFEREKKKMERNRFNRLLEFERKRTVQRLEREKLAAEAAAAIQAAQKEIEKRNVVRSYRSRSKSKSREKDDGFDLQRRNIGILDNNRERSYSFGFGEDYESSTVDTTSSRDGDFDMYDDYETYSIEEMEASPLSILKQRRPSGETRNLIVSSVKLHNESVAAESHTEQSLLSRILFGRKKKDRIPTKPAIDIYDIYKAASDDTPLSISHILFVECRVIWKQLLKDYPDEWKEVGLIRNRCISDFIILAIYFGAGGLAFRFIEGAFENFYKCGVRRVKRDFIDHLWQSSHNLRFFLLIVNL